jgi:hypothetical protein
MIVIVAPSVFDFKMKVKLRLLTHKLFKQGYKNYKVVTTDWLTTIMKLPDLTINNMEVEGVL